MQVRACGESAGVTDQCDGLAGHHMIADILQQHVVVLVDRHEAVLVLHGDHVAKGRIVAGVDDGALQRGHDALLDPGHEINAVVTFLDVVMRRNDPVDGLVEEGVFRQSWSVGGAEVVLLLFLILLDEGGLVFRAGNVVVGVDVG